jgi:hypothetical protein
LNFSVNHISNEIKSLIKEHKALPLILGVSVTATIIVGTILYFRRKNRIVRFAEKFVGEQEVAGNMGFYDKEFQDMISKYGNFNPGQQWCMSFAKMVWLQKFGTKYREQLDQLMTPSTQQTWDNFENDGSGKFKTSDKPSKGAIVIWQQFVNGSPEFKGHAGIVQNYNDTSFDTVEGNTNSNPDGSFNEGIVSEKTHTYNWDVNNGLRLKGFISLA